jgi:PAS domain S-box-containing protein
VAAKSGQEQTLVTPAPDGACIEQMVRFGMTSTPSPELSRSSEIDYRSMFEQSALGMGYLRLADVRWVEVNNAFCQMLWRSREEMLSTSWLDMTHPDDAGIYHSVVQRMMEGEGSSYTVEKRFIHAKDHQVWTRSTFSVVRDPSGSATYANVIIEDISERKSIERELGEGRVALDAERKKLQVILDTIPTGFIMLDDKGAMVIENSEWKRTWGGNALLNGVVDYDQYKGFRPDSGERISKEEWPCAVSLIQGVETRDVILDIERFNGTRGTIVVSSAPIRDATGRVVAAVAANMDITQLRTAQARLLETDRRKDEFLAMLGHELRNPLAPISSAAEMLRIVAHSDPMISKASEVISRQVKHLTALVDDLLDVARVTKGVIELDRQVVDFDLIIQSAIEQSRPLLESRKHTLSIEGSASHATVIADRNRLIQVLSNLLNNAAKYTTEAGHIILSVRTNDDSVVVEVKDNGVGIEPKLLPQIFDLFTQAQRTPDRLQGGLGIGLALVKAIMILHGGQILASSDGLGAGSKFTMLLPKIK